MTSDTVAVRMSSTALVLNLQDRQETIQVAIVYLRVFASVCVYAVVWGWGGGGSSISASTQVHHDMSPLRNLDLKHTRTHKHTSDAAISIISNHGDGGAFSRDTTRRRGFCKKGRFRG